MCVLAHHAGCHSFALFNHAPFSSLVAIKVKMAYSKNDLHKIYCCHITRQLVNVVIVVTAAAVTDA